MQSEGMIEDLVRNLSNPNPKLKMLCASAIFRLAEEKESRQLVRAHGGLEPLVTLIDETANHENKVRPVVQKNQVCSNLVFNNKFARTRMNMRKLTITRGRKIFFCCRAKVPDVSMSTDSWRSRSSVISWRYTPKLLSVLLHDKKYIFQALKITV